MCIADSLLLLEIPFVVFRFFLTRRILTGFVTYSPDRLRSFRVCFPSGRAACGSCIWVYLYVTQPYDPTVQSPIEEVNGGLQNALGGRRNRI